MRKISTTLAAFLMAALSPFTAIAQGSPVVVELYTSQGCSSCPPADKILGQLADRSDVIALALHVDFWDYIGWKDVFADPNHTKRQRAYARQGGRRMIYTPQMIIGGTANVEGARPMKLMDGIRDVRKQGSDVDLNIDRNGNRLSIRAARANLSQPVMVQLVRFEPSQQVKILRGENRGKTINYSNVVSSWETLQNWDGKSQLSLGVDINGSDSVAVILQYPGPGRVVGAAKHN